MIEITPGGYRIPAFKRFVPPRRQNQERHQIAIVGGGLTGLTLACDLVERGQHVVVLDEDDSVGVRGSASRGIVYSQKSLEIFSRLGVFDKVAQKGVAWSVGRSLVEEETVYSFDAAPNSFSCQPPFLNIQQFYIEWYLAERLHGDTRADVRWGNRVERVSQSATSAILDVASDGGSYRIEADWVIDCGGLNSAVRNHMGLPTYPAKGAERWLICDVRFSSDLPDERWTWIHSSANEGRAVWRHPMADGIWRIDFQLDDDDNAAMDEAMSRRLLDALLGSDLKYDLIWCGPWSSRTHLLDDFRAGRVFFAGDSAHVFPPFGARGGNSGIQDADNLGWKLAMVLSGQAPQRLLESYSIERRAAALHNTRVASRSLRFVSPQSACERRIQDQIIALARCYPFARALVNTGRLSDPYTYPASSFVSEGGGASLPNAPLTHGDGRSGEMLDLVEGAPIFILIIRVSISKPSCKGPLRVVSIGEGPESDIIDPDGRLSELLGLHIHEAVLIRPDLHIAGYLDLVSADAVNALVKRAIGSE